MGLFLGQAQRTGRRAIVNSAHDERIVRITVEEADHDLVTDTRHCTHSVARSGPAVGHAHATQRTGAPAVASVPRELDFDSALPIDIDLLPWRATNESGLRSMNARLRQASWAMSTKRNRFEHRAANRSASRCVCRLRSDRHLRVRSNHEKLRGKLFRRSRHRQVGPRRQSERCRADDPLLLSRQLFANLLCPGGPVVGIPKGSWLILVPVTLPARRSPRMGNQGGPQSTGMTLELQPGAVLVEGSHRHALRDQVDEARSGNRD